MQADQKWNEWILIMMRVRMIGMHVHDREVEMTDSRSCTVIFHVGCMILLLFVLLSVSFHVYFCFVSVHVHVSVYFFF